MTKRVWTALISCRRGSAAVEMALVVPFLVPLMFGSFELGNYFLENHVVQKAVRDGARYAARRVPLLNRCDSTIAGANTSPKETDIKNITLYGQLTAGTARLHDWTDLSTVTISYACSSDTSFRGIYTGMGDSKAPVVTVTADITYVSILGSVGFPMPAFEIHAQSQAVVNGA